MERKDPPDPGPRGPLQADSKGTLKEFDVQEENQEQWRRKEAVQREFKHTFTGINLRNKDAVISREESTLKGEEDYRDNTSQHPLTASNHHTHSKCSVFCSMATSRAEKLMAAAIASGKGEVAKELRMRRAEEDQKNQAAAEERAAPVIRRAGKEVMNMEEGAEKKTLIVNMSDARKVRPAQFLAVGLFLSALLVNWRTVIDHMKRVWKIRGRLEANPTEAHDDDRMFVLEFSEEGDWQHAIKGGPWSYKYDAFLVEALPVGNDPLSVQFTHVPMWVQFRGIPFYLLTKQLTRELGEKMGQLLMKLITTN